jgi:glycosyltransferase involved in cell wall biosynthesis
MPTASPYPLVSVIIPTHNRPELLMRAVANVARQTYPSLEVIVVNDGAQGDVLEAIGTAFP